MSPFSAVTSRPPELLKKQECVFQSKPFENQRTKQMGDQEKNKKGMKGSNRIQRGYTHHLAILFYDFNCYFHTSSLLISKDV